MPLSTPGALRVDPLLNSLGNARKIDYFRKNQLIFSLGDHSESVFYIQKGGVKLVVTSRQGKEAVIEVLHGGSFFGENALAPNRHRRLNHAIAVTDVRALRIDPDAMLHMLHKDVDVCDAFISSLIELRVRVQENFANNLLYSSEERLARVLSSIAKSHKDAQAWPKVTQQELCEHDRCNPSTGECPSEAVQRIRWSFIALIVLELESFSGKQPRMKTETMHCGMSG
jgi:CRP-like cAMP-binding protein